MASQGLTKWLLEELEKAGAHEAEVYMQGGSRLELEVVEGKLERVSQADTNGVGIRTIVDGKLSFVYTSDFGRDALGRVVERAVALAGQASADQYNTLPDEKPRKVVMDVFDSGIKSIRLKRKAELLKEMEASALAYDPAVKRIEGAWYSEFLGTVEVANTKGLSYSYDRSSCNMGVGAVAEKNGEMETGHASWTSTHFKRLLSPKELGEIAASRAVVLLGAKPVGTQKAPVVFDPDAGFTLLACLGQALRGDNVNKGMSYLGGRKEEKIGSELVTLRDNGRLQGGPASRPVDAEGVATSNLVLIEKGVLKNFLYDYSSAIRAGASPTGNAVRDGYRGLPGVGLSNYYMDKGTVKPEQIVKNTQNGFFVMKLSGWWVGMNPASPDYSSAATGRWIRNGELAEPVSGVSIASTVPDMLAGVDAVANDLVFSDSVRCPTFRVREMSISGPGK
ncbi:MAG: TldD/PmbA family protein [Candidatus Eiseniibacteriota bacterium]|nr:MAG: TldD/PmbA family protein [Candidatus Eisenbacteria bacterium]